MRKAIHILAACLLLLSATSCDDFFNVHEWPDGAGNEQTIILQFIYETKLTEWDHTCEGSTVTEEGYGGSYDNAMESGVIRYVVRAYPRGSDSDDADAYTNEFTFTKDIDEDGYDSEVAINLLPGDYDIIVWSDLVEQDGDDWFYDEGDFARITFSGDEHYGNEDYRDAFRGSTHISVEADIEDSHTETLEVLMQRPLAKFEFITTDLTEFITKEQLRLEELALTAVSDKENAAEIEVNVEDYKVVFYYINFMPDTYNIFTDKPINSSTGVTFESSLEKISDDEASVGFDYVFVNGTESYVVVQIGIYDNEGTQLSMSNAITIPLKRSYHTVISGKFITSEASGGIGISTEYDGSYNIYVD